MNFLSFSIHLTSRIAVCNYIKRQHKKGTRLKQINGDMFKISYELNLIKFHFIFDIYDNWNIHVYQKIKM